MGFGRFLGDLARGYVEERGIKGTLEDIGDLAGGLFSGSDDDDEMDGDKFIDTFDNYIEQEEPDKAIALVEQFYEDLDEDYLYSYLLAEAYSTKAKITRQISDANTAQKYADTARKSCPIGEDMYDECKRLQSSIKELIEEIKQGNALIENWNRTCDEVSRLTDRKEFDKAADTLLRHYKKFENGEFDYFYWREMAKILYATHFACTDSSSAEKYYTEFLNALSKAKTLTDDEELNAEIRSMQNWDKKVFQSPRPVNEATVRPSDNNSPTDNEQEYLEEVKACLADDGVISDRERRLLTKLSKSLGISEERAAELEAMCTRIALSADEQEYVDEYRACLADDGIVSDRERRLLDKLAKSLGITPDRAKELESM